MYDQRSIFQRSHIAAKIEQSESRCRTEIDDKDLRNDRFDSKKFDRSNAEEELHLLNKLYDICQLSQTFFECKQVASLLREQKSV